MRRAPLGWRPSTQAIALAAVGALGAAGALALHRPELLAVGTPALWALLTRAPEAEPSSVAVTTPPDLRMEEAGSAALTVSVSVGEPVAHLAAAVVLPTAVVGPLSAHGAGRSIEVAGELTAQRWGRHQLGPVRVSALGSLGMRRATVDVVLDAQALVRPTPAPLQASSAPAVLPNRMGEHVSRHAGPGVEPIGVRAWTYGDDARHIDWRATSRRGALHVTVTAAERSVDLVLIVDALSDVGSPPETSLDLAVRAAAGMATRWLRDRDRVGLVVMGGSLRWLTPATGPTQQLRVAEAVLQAWLPPGEILPDLRRVPPQVVPAGAVVVVLSPLLHQAALDAVVAVRQRARRVLVVDVLGRAEPTVNPRDPTAVLALRLWRLERVATAERLRRTGTPVLRPSDGDLDRLVALALRSVR